MAETSETLREPGAREGGPAPAPLEVRDVAVVYPNGFRALDGVGLALGDGEIVALLGASGSGKSTLLRAIEGLEPLERGEVFMRGLDVSSVPTHLRPCTMVFQDGQLFPHRTVGGNIAYAMEGRRLGFGRGRWRDGRAGLGRDGRGSRRARVREEVEKLLGLVGLPGFADRQVSTLSGGQAQRVALARSLARRTGLILFDEPLSALDAELRVSLGNDLRRILKETGTAALYVTHDVSEARRVADRVERLGELRTA